MEFVNPGLLAGAGLAVVPIVLHMIMRRKARRVEFPALRFVRRRRERNRRRLRIRHWLLLALRAAVLLLLAAALARPSLRATGVAGDRDLPVAAALVFDTAPRMLYRHENQTRLEQARDTALWLVRSLPDDSQVAVGESEFGANVFQVDRAAAIQRLERLDTTWTPQPLGNVLSDALRLLEGASDRRKELYIFTDLSRAGWLDRQPAALQERIQDAVDVAFYLIDVGVQQATNCTLDELRLSNQMMTQSGTLHIDGRAQCRGVRKPRLVELYLLGDDPPVEKRGEATLEFGDDGTTTFSFQLSGLDVGTRQGYVRLVGDDGLDFDNTRFFSVSVRTPWPVLLAAQPPVESSTLIVKEAIAPAAFRRTGMARFACDMAQLDELRDTPLESYAAICLLDPPGLSTEVWRRLAAYVSQGGGLLVALGPAIGDVERFNTTAARELLPAELLRQGRAPAADVAAAPSTLEHPVLARLRPMSGSIPWDAYPVYRYWQLGRLVDGAAVIIPLNNGDPLLVERAVGRGRVLTLTTSLSYEADAEPWNELLGFDAWPFFVVTNEMVMYLAGTIDARLNYDVGQVAVLPTGAEDPIATYVLTDPQGERFRRTTDPEQATLAVAATSGPGNYRIQSGGSNGGIDRGFSANVPAVQSDLDRITPEDLNAIFGEGRFLLAESREELVRVQGEGRVGRELFPWLVVLLAAAFIGEYFVAQRFYPASAAGPGENVERAIDSLRGSSSEEHSGDKGVPQQAATIGSDASTAAAM
mgnify:CR=1 FL=1